jgi:hypothetical protein
MRTAGHPDINFILACFEPAPGVDLEKFGMQGPLEKAKSQFFDSNIYLRPFHVFLSL